MKNWFWKLRENPRGFWRATKADFSCSLGIFLTFLKIQLIQSKKIMQWKPTL